MEPVVSENLAGLMGALGRYWIEVVDPPEEE